MPTEVKLLSRITSTGQPTFPWKLHMVLEECEQLGYEDIISWQGDRMFRIHEPKRFEEEIMKSYFKQTQYRSFQRQLNLYGFRRLKGDFEERTYVHDYFIRGKSELCCFMHRAKIKKKGLRGATEVAHSANITDPVGSTNSVRETHNHSNEITLGRNDISRNIGVQNPESYSMTNSKPVVLDDAFSPIPIQQIPVLYQSCTQRGGIPLPQADLQNQCAQWNLSEIGLQNFHQQKQMLIGQLHSSRRTTPEALNRNTSCNPSNTCLNPSKGVDLDLDTIFDDTIT